MAKSFVVTRKILSAVLVSWLTLPALLVSQTLSDSQAAELRAKVLSVREDLTLGNYHLAAVKTAEVGLLVGTGSAESKAAAAEGIQKMAANPLPASTFAPEATAPLVPLVDQLLQSIDARDTAAAREQIHTLMTAFTKVFHSISENTSVNSQASGDPTFANYLELDKAFMTALAHSSVAQSVALAAKFQLVVIERHEKKQWTGAYGWNLYKINDAFGRAAIAKGDYPTALTYLATMAETPSEGASHMCCFGPNLWLAQSLLSAGYRGEVLAFLQSIAPLWTDDSQHKVDGWIAELKRGEVPDMRPNNLVDFRYKF